MENTKRASARVTAEPAATKLPSASVSELGLLTGHGPIAMDPDTWNEPDPAEVVIPRRYVILYCDCDGNGSVDSLDFLCFGRAHAASMPFADRDRNGVFDQFDFILFQQEMLAEMKR